MAFEAGFGLLAFSLVLPLLVGRYLPIQDLPQHAAAVRVLHDYDTEAFRVSEYFEVDLARTQYLAVYVVADLFAYLVGPIGACKLLLALILIGTPYAMRHLLAQVKAPQSYALLTLPLAYNAHFQLGFLNFLLGIPLMLWGIALGIQLRASPEQASRWYSKPGLLLAAVLLLTFYSHVVPFALLGVALGLLVLGVGRAQLKGWLVAVAPSAMALAVWVFSNPAGRSVAGMTEQWGDGGAARFSSVEANLEQAPGWLLDVLPGDGDSRVLVGWVVLVVLVFGLGRVGRRRWRARLAWMPPLAIIAYFTTPTSYEWIWPINARFPLLALLLVIPVLPPVSRLWRPLFGLGFAALALDSTHQVTQAFERSARSEYAGLHAIIEEIPAGSRVAGLVWSRGSKHVKFAPFLHAVAWYQAEKGGAVMFTFADFPQSPFYFREDRRPPRVPPRWEWKPGRVDPEADLEWYEYAITRGGPRSLAGFRFVEQKGSWRLFERE